MSEVIIYNPRNLKLKHFSGKIYNISNDTEILKYDDEIFEVVKSQDKLF